LCNFFELSDLAAASSAGLILRFTLSHPGVSSAIVGTSNPEHLRSNVAAASSGPLPEDL
jgi:aryl-alcohol dehydrogenase-like predicted oxidoreductase